MENLNLENPIFVIYVNIDGLSRNNAVEKIAQCKEIYSYENVSTIVMPINHESKIECLWKGTYENLSNTQELFNYIISLINDGDDTETIRQNIRNFSLNLLNIK